MNCILDSTRDPQQYRTVFERMYGKEAVQQAWAAVAEKVTRSITCQPVMKRLKTSKNTKLYLVLMRNYKKPNEKIGNRRFSLNHKADLMSALFISTLKTALKSTALFTQKRLNLCYNPSQFFDQKE